jgi:hypothetical protein
MPCTHSLLVLGANVLVHPGTNFVIFGKVRGRCCGRTKGGGWSTRSSGGTTYVRLRIANADFFPASSSGDGIHGRVIAGLKSPVVFHSFLRGSGRGQRLCTIMPHTISALNGYVGLLIMAAAFHLRASMHPTNSAMDDLVGASLVAAVFHLRLLCAMPPTNHSALMGIVVRASLVAAAVAIPPRAMPNTHPALDGYIGASLVAAAFLRRAVPKTLASLLGIVRAPLVAA